MTILKLIITKFNNISYCHEENYIKIYQFISDTGGSCKIGKIYTIPHENKNFQGI